jgi:two-component system, NarL family, nitrate/nitrite response regulator NarL
MRILICDGHRVFADALASLLRSAGHRIVGSTVDLGEAVALLGAGQGGRLGAGQGGRSHAALSVEGRGPGEPADACVIDLRLPRSGQRPEIGRAIAAAPGTAFVALSGSADPSALRHAVASGVRGVALKGDDFGEFLRVLTQAAAAPGRTFPEGGPVIMSTSARAALKRGNGLAAGPSQFLTEREREALSRLVRGESTTGMARAMGVRVSTARTHIDAVLSKLGAHTRLEAVAYAVREGLVDMSGWHLEQPAVAS